MAAATGEFVLLLNSDTYVEDDVIGRCALHLLARPDGGMLGCELRFPHGRRKHTANRRLSIRRSLIERLWLYRLLPAARRGEHLLGCHCECRSGRSDADVRPDAARDPAQMNPRRLEPPRWGTGSRRDRGDGGGQSQTAADRPAA